MTKDLNLKGKNMKLLEENVEESLWNLELGRDS